MHSTAAIEILPQVVTPWEWKAVIRRARLGFTVTSIARAIADYANPDGTNAFPGVARLVVETEASDRTVRNALAKLVSLGLLIRVRKGNRAPKGKGYSSKYSLALPSAIPEGLKILTPAEYDDEILRLGGNLSGEPAAGGAGGSEPAPPPPEPEGSDRPAGGAGGSPIDRQEVPVDSDRPAGGAGEVLEELELPAKNNYEDLVVGVGPEVTTVRAEEQKTEISPRVHPEPPVPSALPLRGAALARAALASAARPQLRRNLPPEVPQSATMGAVAFRALMALSRPETDELPLAHTPVTPEVLEAVLEAA